MENKINKNMALFYPMIFGVFYATQNKRNEVVVNKSGKCIFKENNNKLKLNLFNIYLIRGFFFFIYGIYYTFLGIFNNYENKSLMKTSKNLNISFKTVILFFVSICSILISCFILGVLPIKLAYWLGPKNFDLFLKRIIIAFVKCGIVYIILLLIKILPNIKQYYRLNSACLSYQRQHNKVNFLSYFICSLFLSFFITSVIGLTANVWYFFIVNVFICVIIFTFNYELYYEIQKNKYVSWIIKPFEFLIYEKSTQTERKCVNMLLDYLTLYNDKKEKLTQVENKAEEMMFVEAYSNAKEILTKNNKFEKSDLDFIFCEVLNKNRAEVKLIKTISKEDYKKVLNVVERRAKGEPITKIFCHTNFYGLDFIVTKDVLSPRMDTEVLVEQVLKNSEPKMKVLDIGTGSGAIAITIAKEGKCNVTAVDISIDALKVAEKNAKLNNVKVSFKNSNLFSNVGKFEKFDIIVSNPPYIPTKDMETLDEEVKNYDPSLALDGGETGLDFYKKIIEEAPIHLKKNGKIFFEVGINQSKDVKKLLQKNFKDITIVKDYNKIDRVVYGTLNN